MPNKPISAIGQRGVQRWDGSGGGGSLKPELRLLPLCLPDFSPHLTVVPPPGSKCCKASHGSSDLWKTRAVGAFPRGLLPSASGCETSAEIINRAFLAVRRVTFTPNGAPEAAATGLGAAWQGQPWGAGASGSPR